MNIFGIIITREKTLSKKIELAKASLRNQLRQANDKIDLDTKLLDKLRKGYTLEDFVNEYGDRSVQNCSSWVVTARLMPMYFPEVWCECVRYDYVTSKWEAKINGCKEIDPLKVKMRELPEMIASMAPCKATCPTCGKEIENK